MSEATLLTGEPATDTATTDADTADAVTALADWIAREQLATPVFGLVTHAVQPGVDRLRTELRARISYATKANAHPVLVQKLAGLVEEFNVTNLDHLDQLLAMGIEPNRIAWLHPILTPTLVDAVYGRGVRRFVIDDQAGLDRLTGRRDVRLTLRVRPPDLGESARSVARFGNTEDVLLEVGRAADAAGFDIEAVSFFVGTHGDGMGAGTPYRGSIEAAGRLRRRLAQDSIVVGTVNIGGGFPGSRRTLHTDHPNFFTGIRTALNEEFPEGVDVLCEPGRFFAEPSLVLVSRVLAARHVAGHNLVYLDSGAYNGLFEQSIIDAEDPLAMWTADRDAPRDVTRLLGPVMDSFDVVRKDRRLPRVRTDELVAFPNVGAYALGYTVGCEGTRPAEVRSLPDDLSIALSGRWFP